jgi:putative spermidine/putrescine transport system ATP-binding protein
MSNSIPLRLHQVSKSFGSVQALKPTTLHVSGGEMLALLGPSGCGKTTTLRIIAGFGTPDTGSVYIWDRDVTDLPPNKRGLGMVFQNYSLFPHMTVAQNVAFGLDMRGVPKDECTTRVRSMLELVRLAQYEDRSIHQLSGGQQQRVALARSLVTNPAVLLLDEPLGALDRNLRERMQFELREIQKRLGITSIIVTHDQEEALTMSDRVAVMAEGQIVQIGAPIDVYERPATQFVSEFLGTANIFPGTVASEMGPGTWEVQLLTATAATVVSTLHKLRRGQPVKIAVRPERLKFGAAGTGLTAKVQDVVFRGSYWAYELQVSERDEPVFVYANSREELPGDGIVGLTWPAEYAIVLGDGVAS